MDTRMNCLQITQWGTPPKRTEAPVTEPGFGEVLIEVEATGVGLTVQNAINGDLGNDQKDLPRVPGHELVGRVAEVKNPQSNLTRGDLVTAYFYLICGHCDNCLSGDESLCRNFEGFLGVAADGGYAEYVTLPVRNVVRLPDGIDPIDATTVPDAIGTPYHIANQRAAIEPGDDVMVLGAGGGVGIHMVQVAQFFGGTVTAVDQTERKLDMCTKVGAHSTINTATQSLSAAAEQPKGPYDVIIDFTGSMELIEEAIDLLGFRGKLVNLTAFPDESFSITPRRQVLNEIEIVGSRYCARHELKRAAELVEKGHIEPVVTETTDLDGVAGLLETIRSGDLIGRGAMVP